MTFGMSLLLGELARLYSVALKCARRRLHVLHCTKQSRRYGASWNSITRTVVSFPDATAVNTVPKFTVGDTFHLEIRKGRGIRATVVTENQIGIRIVGFIFP
jgi:hypothetical protein